MCACRETSERTRYCFLEPPYHHFRRLAVEMKEDGSKSEKKRKKSTRGGCQE